MTALTDRPQRSEAGDLELFRRRNRLLTISVVMLTLVAACAGDASDTAESSTSSVAVAATSVVTTTVAPPTTSGATTTSTLQFLEAPVVLVAGGEILSPVPSVVDADGHLVLAYVSPESELRVVRCNDRLCDDPVDEVVLGYPGEPAGVDIALLPDGSPVVVVQSWGLDHVVVYACEDPECDTVESSELLDSEPCIHSDGSRCQFSVDYPSVIVGSDGLPRVIYLNNTNPRSVKVATCQSRTCSGWEWATIDQLPPDTGSGALSVRIDDQERLFVGYWYDMPPDMTTSSRVAICGDLSCSEAPDVLTFNGSVFAQTTPGANNDEFLVWHRTGAPSLPVETADPQDNFAALWSEYSDYLVSACTAAGCADPIHIEVGEDWLLAKSAGAFHLYTADDGTTGAFFNHASRTEPTPQLHITTCSDVTCTEGVTTTVGIDTIIHGNYDVIISPDTPPRVVYTSTEGGIHLHTCTNQTCTR